MSAAARLYPAGLTGFPTCPSALGATTTARPRPTPPERLRP